MTSDQKDGWQPIDTAPKDGTLIDVWQRDWRICNAFWSDAQEGWCVEGYYPEEPTPLAIIPKVTHWMPPPSPPKDEADADSKRPQWGDRSELIGIIRDVRKILNCECAIEGAEAAMGQIRALQQRVGELEDLLRDIRDDAQSGQYEIDVIGLIDQALHEEPGSRKAGET